MDNRGMRFCGLRLPMRREEGRAAASVSTRLIGLLGSGLVAALAGCAGPAGNDLPSSGNALARATSERGTSPHFVYSPYKYVPVALAPDSGAISAAVTGGPTPIVVNGRSTLPTGVTALTLAFATGECGAETWDGMDPRLLADGNLRAFVRAGIDYIISTGGEAGVFTCATDAGMEAFIARYASPRLIGFDFDIERGQSAEIVGALVQRIKAAKERHPQLRFSFTLATWGASDGSQVSLNDDGQRVMQAIRDAGLADYYVNLMVMDYGDAIPRNCVVSVGVCHMGLSAIQAARNLNARFGVPMSRIELTPMIGVNDVVANVFTLDDATTVARFVRESAAGGLHFWSLDRDVPCPADVSRVSSICSGLTGMPGFAFTEAFRAGLR